MAIFYQIDSQARAEIKTFWTEAFCSLRTPCISFFEEMDAICEREHYKLINDTVAVMKKDFMENTMPEIINEAQFHLAQDSSSQKFVDRTKGSAQSTEEAAVISAQLDQELFDIFQSTFVAVLHFQPIKFSEEVRLTKEAKLTFEEMTKIIKQYETKYKEEVHSFTNARIYHMESNELFGNAINAIILITSCLESVFANFYTVLVKHIEGVVTLGNKFEQEQEAIEKAVSGVSEVVSGSTQLQTLMGDL